VSRLIRFVIRAGIRRGWDRGVLDGNRTWIVVGGAALIANLAGRALHREPEVVFLEKLEPGQSFRITHEAPK